MNKIITTNCLVYQHPKLLLGMKKRGFAQGRWNGFGGKVAEGETVEAAAKRELFEEVGIVAEEIVHRATMIFEYPDHDKMMEVNIFEVTKWSGESTESEEMKPQWFDISELPLKQMWPDDEHWFPLFFAGKNWTGHFVYEGYEKIVKFTLEAKQQ